MNDRKKKKISAAVLTRIVLIISIAVLTGSIAVKNLSGAAAAAGRPGRPGASAGQTAGAAGTAPAGSSTADSRIPVMKEEAVFSVNTENPVRAQIKEFIKVNGDITAENSVEIYPDTSGKLVKRYVSIGDYVSKGEVIAKIDPSKPGTVYEASPVESTISGTVTSLPGSIGDTMSISSSIAEIGDLSKLQIEVFIPEKEITWIKKGLTGSAELAPFPGEFIPVQIVEVSPVLDPDSRTLEVKLSASGEKEKRMKAGMFASVLIYTRTAENVLTLPLNAVLSDEKGEYVYTAVNGKASVKHVETGLKSASRVEIISGLDAEDSVIVRGQNLVNEGASVREVGGGK